MRVWSTDSRKHSGASNHTQSHPCAMPCDIPIIHRNAQSRWVSRLGKGVGSTPLVDSRYGRLNKSTKAHIILRIWNRTQQSIKHNYWEHLV